MIKAYKQLTNGVMRAKFTEKVWAAFPPHKHKWMIDNELKKDIPSEILEFMSNVSMPDDIVEIEHNFPEEFNTEENDNQTPEDGRGKRGKQRSVAKNARVGDSPKVSSRKKK